MRLVGGRFEEDAVRRVAGAAVGAQARGDRLEAARTGAP